MPSPGYFCPVPVAVLGKVSACCPRPGYFCPIQVAVLAWESAYCILRATFGLSLLQLQFLATAVPVAKVSANIRTVLCERPVNVWYQQSIFLRIECAHKYIQVHLLLHWEFICSTIWFGLMICVLCMHVCVPLSPATALVYNFVYTYAIPCWTSRLYAASYPNAQQSPELRSSIIYNIWSFLSWTSIITGDTEFVRHRGLDSVQTELVRHLFSRVGSVQHGVGKRQTLFLKAGKLESLTRHTQLNEKKSSTHFKLIDHLTFFELWKLIFHEAQEHPKELECFSL